MSRYPSIENIHPEIRAFFEKRGKLVLDDDETPTACFIKPNDGRPGYSIALSVSELRWLGLDQGEYSEFLRDRPWNEWIYSGPYGLVAEETMLKLIKLVGFW